MKTSKASFAKIAKILSIVVVTAITTLTLTPAFAVSKSVTLSIPTMDCEVCPITVKKALNTVKGVSRIDVDPRKRIVQVSFDDTWTSASALIETTKNAGYPSHVVRMRL
ncbi:MAG: mercury resistance system periplasmic binding protein MerP [Gallionella sp.]